MDARIDDIRSQALLKAPKLFSVVDELRGDLDVPVDLFLDPARRARTRGESALDTRLTCVPDFMVTTGTSIDKDS